MHLLKKVNLNIKTKEIITTKIIIRKELIMGYIVLKGLFEPDSVAHFAVAYL
jgi:hypothetical protein